MNNIRTVVQEGQKNIIVMDVFSKLIQERIIFIDGLIDEELSNGVVAQMLYLDAQSQTEPINIYINSPGGSVTSGMAIYDTMNYIKCDVSTIYVGMAASMGSFLLAGGAKGKRFALPNAEIMIHQPSGGAKGQATDIKIAVDHILKSKRNLNRILSENTGKPLEQIELDTDRDNFMSAAEAKEYGLIDEVMK